MYVYGYIHTLSVLTHVYSSAYIYLSVKAGRNQTRARGLAQPLTALPKAVFCEAPFRTFLEEGV